MNGYEYIKVLKKQLRKRDVKLNIPDLLVLSNQNDPFYCGSPADIEKADWFQSHFVGFQLAHGVHLRRIHYRLVSQKTPFKKPDGKPYENTENDWAYLNAAARNARYLGLVDADDFVDRRNPDPILNIDLSYYASSPSAWLDPDFSSWHLPELRVVHNPQYYIPSVCIGGYYYEKEDQPYHLEVWVEKTTMEDVLAPICRHYNANLVQGAGYLSISRVKELLLRSTRFGKPVRLFYISDFDPSGDNMPRQVARQIEFWVQRETGIELKIHHLALTKEQCIKYQLPRTPLKDSDKRKEGWEAQHGEGATELDALEALHPGELHRIVTEAMAPYFDRDLEQRMEEAEDEAELAVANKWEEVTADESIELDQISKSATKVVESYEEEVEEIRKRMSKDLKPFRKRLESVSQQIKKKSQALEKYLPDRAEPEIGAPDESEWLFSTDREYFGQLKHYKAHQAG